MPGVASRAILRLSPGTAARPGQARHPMNANRESWRLAWPLILSNLSVPLLGVVDTAVVGHLDAPRYLGGVALGALVMSVLYWLFGFLRMGTTALTAQAFGAADTDEMRARPPGGRCSWHSVWACWSSWSGRWSACWASGCSPPRSRWGWSSRAISRSGCLAPPRPWPTWCCWAGCWACRIPAGPCS